MKARISKVSHHDDLSAFYSLLSKANSQPQGFNVPNSSKEEDVSNEVEAERAVRRKKSRASAHQDHTDVYDCVFSATGPSQVESIHPVAHTGPCTESNKRPGKSTEKMNPTQLIPSKEPKKAPSLMQDEFLEDSNDNCIPLHSRGDSRMNRAVAAKLRDPKLTLMEALKLGGFEYSEDSAYDEDGVSLSQRKNQLSRRVRLKKKQMQG